MELKLFVAENPAVAEAEVNRWLQNKSRRVQHVSQSQSEKNGRFVFVIAIYYILAGKTKSLIGLADNSLIPLTLPGIPGNT